MNRREFLRNLEFKIAMPILAVAGCDENPVSSGNNIIKRYQNYDLFGNLGVGSGIYYKIILMVYNRSYYLWGKWCNC